MNTQTQYSLIGKFSQYFLLLSRIINAHNHIYILYVYKFIIRHHIVLLLLFIIKIVLFFSLYFHIFEFSHFAIAKMYMCHNVYATNIIFVHLTSFPPHAFPAYLCIVSTQARKQ